MDLTPPQERLLKALAIAIVDRPRDTFKELAEAAGVSKATLNRFCGTRENLAEMLMVYSSKTMNRVIASAGLNDSDPIEALHELIELHLAQRELLMFLIVQWRRDSLDEEAEDLRWKPYSDAMDAFFLRGQTEGFFRIDVSAPVLTELFASILFGLIDAERRGRIARCGMASLVESSFLRGAMAP